MQYKMIKGDELCESRVQFVHVETIWTSARASTGYNQ